MRQKLIQGHLRDFQKSMNFHLEGGWTVVGNIATSKESYTYTPNGSYAKTEIKTFYTAIVEQPKEPTS